MVEAQGYGLAGGANSGEQGNDSAVRKAPLRGLRCFWPIWIKNHRDGPTECSILHRSLSAGKGIKVQRRGQPSERGSVMDPTEFHCRQASRFSKLAREFVDAEASAKLLEIATECREMLNGRAPVDVHDYRFGCLYAAETARKDKELARKLNEVCRGC